MEFSGQISDVSFTEYENDECTMTDGCFPCYLEPIASTAFKTEYTYIDLENAIDSITTFLDIMTWKIIHAHNSMLHFASQFKVLYRLATSRLLSLSETERRTSREDDLSNEETKTNERGK